MASLRGLVREQADQVVAFGLDAASLSAIAPEGRDLVPDASAARVFVHGGIHGGRTLRDLATDSRGYLYRMAADRWPTDPAVATAALQALMGVPVTVVPAGWDQRPEASVRDLVRLDGATAPVNHPDPGPDAAFSDLVPTRDAIDSGARAVETGTAGPKVSVVRDGERLLLEFDYDAALVKRVRGIHGSSFDGDRMVWSVPLDGAVRLADEPRFLRANPTLLSDLAERYRPVVEARDGMRDLLSERRIAPASDIRAAHCPRSVLRSSVDPEQVVAAFEFNEAIGDWLFKKVGSRYRKKEGGHVFEARDLVVVADGLWKLGFVFEDVLIDQVRASKRLMARAAEVARGFEHPLRGAPDAELDYEAANGIVPWGFQRADIRFGLDCLRERGGVGKWLQMGVGKTIETAVEYDLLRRETPGLRILVMSPRSAFSAWRRELGGMLPARMFYGRRKTGDNGRAAMEEALAAPDRGPVGVVLAGTRKAREEALLAGPDIVVVNYDSARVTVEPLRAWIRSGGPVLFVCDESHTIKDPTTQNSRAVLELLQCPQVSGEGGGRVALTGTPISNPANIYMQAVFIDGGFDRCRFGPSYRAFVDRYFHVDNWGRVKGFKSSALESEYTDLVAYCTVRRTSEEAQDLPDLSYSLWEAVYDGGIEQAGYAWLIDLTRQEVEEGLADGEEIDMARITLRMRQWESHPANIWHAYVEACERLAEWTAATAEWRAARDAALRAGASSGDDFCAETLRALGGADEEGADLREYAASQLVSERLANSPTTRWARSEALKEVAVLQRRIDGVKVKNDDLLAMPEKIRTGLEKFVGSGQIPVKLQSLVEYVEEALGPPDAKVIITCDFDHTERAIAEALKAYDPVWYQASLNDEARAALEDTFQKDPARRVFLGKSKTIHTGLTLTAARHMALYDAACGFNTVVWEQVQKRHHRGEQTQKCTVDHFVVAETIGPYALSRVIERANLASRLLRDTISSLPSGLRAMVQGGGAPKDRGDVVRMLNAFSGGR